MKLRYVLHLLVGLLAFSGTAVMASDWPQFRGPERTGVSSESGWTHDWPKSGPKVLWSADLGESYASPVIAQNRAYVVGSSTTQDTVQCLDTSSGKQVWKAAFSHGKRTYPPDLYSNALISTPLLSGDRLYILAREGDLFCLDSTNGKVIWRNNLIKITGATAQYFGNSSSPLIEGDLLLFNVGKGGAALHKDTGKVVWKSTGMGGYASPISYSRNGKREVALFGTDTVIGIEPLTGKRLWSFPWKVAGYTAPSADPIFTGDALIAHSATAGTKLLRFGTASPKVAWENKNLCSDFVNSVVVGKYIYGNNASRLVCLDAATGKLMWSEKGMGQGSLIAADGKLIIQTERGELIIAEANPAKYTELARSALSDGKAPLKNAGYVTPVLANGMIYCRVPSGKLVCLDVRKN